MSIKDCFIRMKDRLGSLSFRTGVAVLGVCVLCYVLSFAQLLLPLGAGVKGVLWAVLFGMAKAAQYTALLILGKVGVERVRQWFNGRRDAAPD